MNKNIAIIGAGISGMATAYMLLRKQYNITIFSKAFSPHLTSNKAAAFWFPYHIRNDKRGIHWCNTSYDHYSGFATNPKTGVSMHQLIKVVANGINEEEPVWKDFMPDGSYKMVDTDKLQPGFSKAYDVQVPLIETQIFLPYLQQLLIQNGVAFIEKGIKYFEDLSWDYDLVINCAALGARELCNDESIFPVRGQVGLLKPKEGLPIYLDNEKPMYIVPRKDAIIIGGTYEEHIDTETTEPETIKRLIQNACEQFPALRSLPIIGSWAGLRPYRHDIRVEHEQNTNIIHNYGHGGSGFTLAFGCANSVKEMTNTFFNR
jgi:D-amino-acid oxidase